MVEWEEPGNMHSIEIWYNLKFLPRIALRNSNKCNSISNTSDQYLNVGFLSSICLCQKIMSHNWLVSTIFLYWNASCMRISRQHTVTWWTYFVLTTSWPVSNACATPGLVIPAFCTTFVLPVPSTRSPNTLRKTISIWSGPSIITKRSCSHWLVKEVAY